MLRRLANFLDPQHTRMSSAETDDTITLGSTEWDSQFRTRINYDRDKVLAEVVNAWRSNPIAKRIIEITTEFILGDGFGYGSDDAKVKKFLTDFWTNPLNDIDSQLSEWADESWRSGDLFLLVSMDAGGMPYVRAIPGENISEIIHTPNDYRQELYYKRTTLDNEPYPSYEAWKRAENPESAFVLHFPLNRAVGAPFGESDLASVLYWIRLYRQFLDDRARLNYFRQLFTFILQKAFPGGQPEKDRYVADFMAHMPKKAGGLLALDPGENLGTINPNLASFEAEQDGLMLKRMIAVGVQMPMHYLAEPESSTSTTADAAGTPTFRRFKSRQKFLVRAITRLLTVVLEIRHNIDSSLPAQPVFTLSAPDITERDNASLALAVLRITQAFAPLYNAKKISAKELMRLVYRFLAEVPPVDEPDDSLPISMSGGGGQTPGKTGANTESNPAAQAEQPAQA